MISAAIVKRIGDNVPTLLNKCFPEYAPENIGYPFLVYRLESVDREQDLLGNRTGCPEANFRFLIFATSRTQVETLSNTVGALFDGFSGLVESQRIYASRLTSQESSEVFVEGNDVPVYSYSNTHTIQFKED